MYSNKLNDFINRPDKKVVIEQLIKNAIAQFAKLEVAITSNSELEYKATKKLVGDRFNINIFQ